MDHFFLRARSLIVSLLWGVLRVRFVPDFLGKWSQGISLPPKLCISEIMLRPMSMRPAIQHVDLLQTHRAVIVHAQDEDAMQVI